MAFNQAESTKRRVHIEGRANGLSTLAVAEQGRDSYGSETSGISDEGNNLQTNNNLRMTTSLPNSSTDHISGESDSVDDGAIPQPFVTPKRNGRRKKSIQITLEPEGRKGKYVLKADDPDIREILRYGIEEEQRRDKSVGKPRRRGFAELVFTRQFTTFDRQNPLSYESPFHGFYTLFWLAISLLLIRVAANNWKEHGTIFGGNEILHMMFERDVLLLGLTDGAMCLATTFGLLLQRMILRGWISWNGCGWIIEHIWQSAYLFAVISWTFYRDWPWSHTVFTVLHCMVFLMKQHSYTFYNGHLSQVYQRKRLLEEKLSHLETMEPEPGSPIDAARVPLLSTKDTPANLGLRQRRNPAVSPPSDDLGRERSEISSLASAIESGRPLDEAQLRLFESMVRSEVHYLSKELQGKSFGGSESQLSYPDNLTLRNFFDWTCLPTLVYELSYPRQEKRDWYYIAEKTVATLGVICVMIIISQAYIYPSVVLTVRLKEAGLPLMERWIHFPWVLNDMLFPMLLEQLLAWFVIWECLLNVLAELTLFADRGFYGAWWNSVSWDQYARDWNRPVHNFLLRHVYHSSISTFKISKKTATFTTFLLSACVHELVMWCIFKKVRGYLFTMQLMQLPLVSLSRTKLLQGRHVLGNLIFWIGLFIGPALITSLYLIV